MKLLPSAGHVPTRTVFIARNGDHLSVCGGERIDLSAKGPVRKIFRALVKSHREFPHRGLSVDDVFEAGWSGNQATPDAVASRVYSAISKLRRLGLAEVVVRTERGYQLDPCVCVIEERPIQARREPKTVIHNAVVPERMAS